MSRNILLTFNTQMGSFILNCIYTFAKVQSVQGLTVCKQCKCDIPIAHIVEEAFAEKRMDACETVTL